MEWNKYFEMMIDWKKLPAYRAEPRIDSLIGYYLQHILSKYLEVDIEGIIPEFPLRLGTIRPEHNERSFAERSYKVDFFAIGGNGLNYLIEFKTDSSSLSEPQKKYLNLAKEAGTEKLIDGINSIAKASTYKEKYRHLTQRINSFGLLDQNLKYSGKNSKLEIVFIQPSVNEKEFITIDFNWIADWFENNYPEKKSFENNFAKALRIWAKD